MDLKIICNWLQSQEISFEIYTQLGGVKTVDVSGIKFLFDEDGKLVGLDE